MRSMPSPRHCARVQRVGVNAMWVVRLCFEFDRKCKALAVYAVLIREDIGAICCGGCGCTGSDGQCAVTRFVSAANAHNTGIVLKVGDLGLFVVPVPTVNSVFLSMFETWTWGGWACGVP